MKNINKILSWLESNKDQELIINQIDNYILEELKGNKFISSILDFGNNFDIDLGELNYYYTETEVILIEFEVIEEDFKNVRNSIIKILNSCLYS